MTLLGVGDPVVDLSTVDLREQVTSIHTALTRMDSLEPGPVVNALFAELVRLCEYRSGDQAQHVLTDPRIIALAPQLRHLCAVGEFLMERSWARRVVAAARPDKELEAFPYLGNYEDLTTLEVHALAGVGLDLDRVRRLCFLGGGPLPLSGLMMSRTLSVPVDVVDVSGEATALGTQVAERLSWSDQATFHCADAADFDLVTESDVVVLAALVGLERDTKRQVLQALSERMRTGSMLVVRSAHGLRTLLYPPLDLSDLRDWRPLSVVHPLNAIVNSVVVAVRR